MAQVPTSRANIPNLLEANVRKAFVLDGTKLPKLYPQFMTVNPSDKKIERDVVVAGYGTYSANPEGANPDYDSIEESWTKTYTHAKYALGAQFTMEGIQDDLHGVIRGAMKTGGGLRKVANYTMDLLAIALFNSTLTSGTAYSAGGSNFAVLSTAHYRADGGTWSNRPTAAMDLSIEALEFMVGHWIANQVNQRGQVSFTMPERLMVGPGDAMLAKRLVNSAKRPQSADNDPNPAGQMLGSDPLVHPLLTNDGRWVVFGDKGEMGLNAFERYGPEVEKRPDGENGNIRLVGVFRFISGMTHANNLWGSP